MSDLTYPETIAVGLLQGVSELFPVSSLGHSVLFPAWLGGRWARDLSMGEHSPYLSVLVAMHVATAIALVMFFWRDWLRVISGLITAVRYRRVSTADERLAVLLLVGTVPVGIAGLALRKAMETTLGKPTPVAVFLLVNGLVLLAAEWLQRRTREREHTEKVLAAYADLDRTVTMSAISVEDTAPITPADGPPSSAEDSDRRLSRLTIGEAAGIGAAQILALLPGISRSGITMVAGMMRGLHHEDAARFAFLLATPVIAAAGVLKIPALFTPAMSGSLGPALVGSLVALVAAYLSVRFLTSYFHTRTLHPFAVYCIAAGLFSLVLFGSRGVA